MSEQEQVPRSKLFTPENLIMGVLIGGLTWGGAQIVTIKEVQASLVTKQVENERVNEFVYESIPDIRVAINTISINQTNMNSKLDGLDTKVSKLTKDVGNTKKEIQTIPDVLTNKLRDEYTNDPTILER